MREAGDGSSALGTTAATTIPEWPARRLNQSAVRSVERGPDWEAFPVGLRNEIDAFLASRSPRKLSLQEPAAKVWAPTTRRVMRAKLQAFARMALRRGVAIETLDSLSALLDPRLVENVLDGYWEQDGETPRTYTIDLARDLLAVARATGAVDSGRPRTARRALQDALGSTSEAA